MNKKMLRNGIIAAMLAMTPMVSMACMTVLVGKDASADGSWIMARSVDSSNATENVELIKHPRVDKESGYFKAYDRAGFKYKLPGKAMAYMDAPDLGNAEEGYGYSETAFNEEGIGESATESIYSSAAALAADPYLEDTGVTENELTEVVAPYAHSAKQGVHILGNIIEKYGSGEGFGVGFIDKDGIWYLENAGGHQWMAAKLPSDKVFVSANEGRLRDYVPGNKNYMASKDLISFAVKHNLYQETDGKFDFHKTYFEETKNDETYNYPRVWHAQQMINPAIKYNVEDAASAPVFISPAKKMTINDIKTIFRDHYTGTDHDAYMHANLKETWRPISVFRCEETHLMQVRPELPKEIGSLTYMAYGMADLGLFLPIYEGAENIPDAYHAGEELMNEKAASWIYRKPQILAMQNYNKYAPIVKKTYSDYEAEIATKQAEMEKQYMALRKTNPAEAQKLLNDFETEVLEGGLKVANNLTHTLMTEMLKDTQASYPFHGA